MGMNEEIKNNGSLKLADILINRRHELRYTIEQMANACEMPTMMYQLFEEGKQKLEDLGGNPLIMSLADGCRVSPDKIRMLCGKTFY